jgi:hypothetical protein
VQTGAVSRYLISHTAFVLCDNAAEIDPSHPGYSLWDIHLTPGTATIAVSYNDARDNGEWGRLCRSGGQGVRLLGSTARKPRLPGASGLSSQFSIDLFTRGDEWQS